MSSGGGCLQSDVGYLISGDLNLFGLNGLVVAGWGWGGREGGEWGSGVGGRGACERGWAVGLLSLQMIICDVTSNIPVLVVTFTHSIFTW